MSEVISRDARPYRLSNIDFLRGLVIVIMGVTFIFAFFVHRATGLYGDANPWQTQEQGWLATARDFMNVTKYPPSLLFLLITLGVLQGFQASEFMTGFLFFPEGYGVGLPGVYLIWVLVLAILYPLCHWMAELKRRRKDWWLSYL